MVKGPGDEPGYWWESLPALPYGRAADTGRILPARDNIRGPTFERGL